MRRGRPSEPALPTAKPLNACMCGSVHGSSATGRPTRNPDRRAVDECRVPGRKILEAEADARERAGPEVLDHDVGVVDQGERELPVRLVLEVEGDGPLALVQGKVRRTEPGDRGSDGEDELVRRLDLDHVCAEPGEERGRERADSAHAEIEDTNADQRSFGVSVHAPAQPGAYPAPRGARDARGKGVGEVEGPRLRMVGALGPPIGTRPRSRRAVGSWSTAPSAGDPSPGGIRTPACRHRCRRPIRPTRATRGAGGRSSADRDRAPAQTRASPPPPARGKSSVIRPSAMAYPESTSRSASALGAAPGIRMGAGGPQDRLQRREAAKRRHADDVPGPGRPAAVEPGQNGLGRKEARDRRRDVAPRASRSLVRAGDVVRERCRGLCRRLGAHETSAREAMRLEDTRQHPCGRNITLRGRRVVGENDVDIPPALLDETCSEALQVSRSDRRRVVRRRDENRPSAERSNDHGAAGSRVGAPIAAASRSGERGRFGDWPDELRPFHLCEPRRPTPIDESIE